MRKTFIIILGLLVTVAVLFVSAEESTKEGLEVGDLAPDFELKNIDGSMKSLSSLKEAKGYIVVFTCNTCPYAKNYEQRIIDLNTKYASKGYPVVAINPNDIAKQPGDSMEEMIKRAKDKNYSFPYLRDDTQEVARTYGATKTPHIFVLNKESEKNYRVEYIGAIDDSPREEADVNEKYVEAAVDALLNGQKPTTTSIHAIGCTIKWKDS